MGILSWLIVGGISGWIASMITGDNPKMGILTNIIVGILGAMIGGFIASNVFKWGTVSGFNLYSVFISVVGAVILLTIVKSVKK
ncbi:MAG: GlsB/YeaQ/YmgE family stress response membrane protein [Tissierellia bacterium]|nr:GlsB/YeaQ/YmgE family stress response membrane protein [Tissierellia bacterium]